MKYLMHFESFDSSNPDKIRIDLINNGYSLDNLKKEGFSQGQKVIKDYKETPDWEPLYNFLREIYGELYLKAADGFMWYGKYDTLYKDEKGNPIIYDTYRHGITRQWLTLKEDGEPIEIKYAFSNFYISHYIDEIYKLSYKKAFKDVYANLAKYIASACKSGDCEMPKELYLVKYSEYKLLRDDMLKKAGYNVITTDGRNLEELKDLKKESQGKYSQATNNLKQMQHTNSVGNEEPEKRHLDGELISDQEADNIDIPYDLTYTGHIKSPQYSLRLRKKPKEPKKRNC